MVKNKKNNNLNKLKKQYLQIIRAVHYLYKEKSICKEKQYAFLSVIQDKDTNFEHLKNKSTALNRNNKNKSSKSRQDTDLG